MNKYLVQDLQPEAGSGSVAMEFMVFMKHVNRCTNYGEEANIGSLQSKTQMVLANKFFDSSMVAKVEAKITAKGELSTVTFARMMVMFKDEYNLAHPSSSGNPHG